MGYRSEVAFVIEFDNEVSARNYFSTLDMTLIAYMKDDIRRSGNYIVFHTQGIKWYVDAGDNYADISHLESFYKRSIDIPECHGYVFRRIGEDNDDIECDYGGENPPYGTLDIVQYLEVHV